MRGSFEVCAAAGITYRQLDYWCRANVLDCVGGSATPGSGGQRRFTDTETRVAWAVGRLAAHGATLPVMRHAGAMLRAMTDDEWHGLLFVSQRGAVTRQPSDGWVLDLGRAVEVAA